MDIHVRASGEDGEPLRIDIARRLWFALGRFADRIVRVQVRLSDDNGPRGGVDQRCQLLVRLSVPQQLIVIEEAHSDMRAAVAGAAHRAARAVARAVAQTRPLHGRRPLEARS